MMNSPASDQIISDEQLAEYQDKGFIVVEHIFSPDDLKSMNEAMSEMIESARGLTEHTDLIDLEPSHTPDNPRVRRIKDPFHNHPVFNKMAKHPKLIAALTQLIGPNLRIHGSKMNLKSATYGSPVEWHQDWAFYPHTNDDILAVGIMLDPMTEDNGPLMCIPGSHKGPTLDHHQDGYFIGAIDPKKCDVDFSRAEKVLGSAGACSFHHVRMIHGSAQNTSGQDRRLLLLEITAADAWDLRGMARIGSWELFQSTVLVGEATNEPRIVPAPIRLPFPEPEKTGSIYESQSLSKSKYFGEPPTSDAAE